MSANELRSALSWSRPPDALLRKMADVWQALEVVRQALAELGDGSCDYYALLGDIRVLPSALRVLEHGDWGPEALECAKFIACVAVALCPHASEPAKIEAILKWVDWAYGYWREKGWVTSEVSLEDAKRQALRLYEVVAGCVDSVPWVSVCWCRQCSLVGRGGRPEEGGTPCWQSAIGVTATWKHSRCETARKKCPAER